MIPLAPKNNLSQKYDRIVYCDMDGVIADFARKSAELGFPVEPQDKDQPKDEEMWNAIEAYGKDKFFADLNWLSDGQKLWNYISENFINVKILTALGKADQVDKLTSKGKRTWLRRNIPMLNDNDILMVPNKFAKKNYARPGDILIDDTEVCIQGWLRKGGIGILHKNANDTIQQLERYV